MLRKAISFTLILAALYFIYQFGVNFLKNEHAVSYVIISSDTGVNIEENYIRKNGRDYYLIDAIADNNHFIFDIENKFNKQRNIVEDVSIYNDGDLYCLTLIFKNKEYTSEPLCYDNGVLSSYYSVKNKYDLKEYISKIPSFELNKYDKNSEKKKEDNIIIYKDNFYENEILSLYSYKKVYFVNKYYNRSFIFSNKDNYKNTLGAIVDHYYVIPRYTTDASIKNFIRYEIIDGVKKEFSAVYSISKQSYVNGVYDGKLYLFDRSSLKQYQIDPKNSLVTIIGDEENEAFAYINGEEKRMSVYDMSTNDVIFSEKHDQYGNDYDEIFVSDYYAIYRKGNNFYKVYSDYLDNPILLFNESGGKEYKIRGDALYYVKDNGVYRYSIYGKQLLITSDELKYNYENVFDIFLTED